MSTVGVTLGIDVGATLCKGAARSDRLELFQFRSLDLDRVCARAEQIAPERIVATGGGASGLPEALAGCRVERMPEFLALAQGARFLVARDELALEPSYLVSCIGTGTSVLRIDAHGCGADRVGGTALGGGTLLGLAQLLFGETSFAELCALAEQGDRRKVDLLVRDIYAHDPPLPGDLNAASFAKLSSREPADLAAALMGLVGENVGLICNHLMSLYEIQHAVYCGAALARNPVLCGILRGLATMTGKKAYVLSKGTYCGAIGATL